MGISWPIDVSNFVNLHKDAFTCTVDMFFIKGVTKPKSEMNMVAVILIYSQGVINHLFHYWSNGIIVSDMYSFFVTPWYPWHDIAAGYSVQCLNIHDDADFRSAKTYECICSFHLFPTLRREYAGKLKSVLMEDQDLFIHSTPCLMMSWRQVAHGPVTLEYSGFGTRKHFHIHLSEDQLWIIMGNINVWFVARLFKQSSTNRARFLSLS